MQSLRRRAIFGGIAWTLVILVIGGIGLFTLIDDISFRRFDRALLGRHVQLVVALSSGEVDGLPVSPVLSDPAYDRPYSGSYWQIISQDGNLLTSRSLFDFMLDPEGPLPDQPAFWSGDGPDGPVRGVRQAITLEGGGVWDVIVAESLQVLETERGQIRQSMLTMFGLIGLMGIIGAALLTRAVLRPLSELREDIVSRWNKGQRLLPEEYPAEVAPLVRDINTLLDRNTEIVDRARRQAADLAHALKTPSVIARNELEDLAANGTNVREAITALDRIDARLKTSLARIRASNTQFKAGELTDLSKAIARLARIFPTLPASEGKTISVDAPGDLRVAMERQDLEEILGNLLENAFAWAEGVIRVTARRHGDVAVVTVEDDGPGIPEADRREALRAGGRLDSAVPGTGLGLAIAVDLLTAYGGALELGNSPGLGGLSVQVTIPGTVSAQLGAGGIPAIH